MSSWLDNERFFEYYYLVKNVYSYAHLLPYKKIFNPDMPEAIFCYVILFSGVVSVFFVLIKFLLIFIYFFVIRLILNLKDFFVSLCKIKGKYPYLTGLKNGLMYLFKNGKKIYTYNFYIFDIEKVTIGDKGNGPLDAFANALASGSSVPKFNITDFHEHSIGTGNNTAAMAYIQIKTEKGVYWGVGKSTNVSRAGIDAIVSALNQIN